MSASGRLSQRWQRCLSLWAATHLPRRRCRNGRKPSSALLSSSVSSSASISVFRRTSDHSGRRLKSSARAVLRQHPKLRLLPQRGLLRAPQVKHRAAESSEAYPCHYTIKKTAEIQSSFFVRMARLELAQEKLPLPPQSSASTISPHPPLNLGLQR